MRRRGWMALGAGLMFAMDLAPAHAAPPTTLSVRGEPAACPSPRAVAEAIAPLLQRTRIVSDADTVSDAVAMIVDLGDGYRVEVGPSARLFADDARRCDERVKEAAVFIVLAVDPPELGSSAPTATRIEPVSHAPLEAQEVVTREPAHLPFSKLTLEAAGLVVNAPSRAMVSAGGVARARLGGESIGVVLGAGALAPSSLALTAAHVQLLRFPLDAGLRARIGLRDLELAADLGLSATILSIHGLDDGARQGGTRLELGARASALAAYWLQDFAPFIALETVLVPSPQDLALHSAGIVGHTPKSWIGANLGMAVRLW
jgi:hypothetical protein